MFSQDQEETRLSKAALEIAENEVDEGLWPRAEFGTDKKVNGELLKFSRRI